MCSSATEGSFQKQFSFLQIALRVAFLHGVQNARYCRSLCNVDPPPCLQSYSLLGEPAQRLCSSSHITQEVRLLQNLAFPAPSLTHT